MKLLTKTVTILLACLFQITLTCRAETWRGITPLVSTRNDVQSILGRARTEPDKRTAEYDLDSAKVRITYSSDSCKPCAVCECQVPNDTVIEIDVTPTHAIRFASLGIDMSQFERFPLAENAAVTLYRNGEIGLLYAVRSDDTVDYIQYSPTQKDCKIMRSLKGKLTDGN